MDPLSRKQTIQKGFGDKTQNLISLPQTKIGKTTEKTMDEPYINRSGTKDKKQTYNGTG